MRCYILVQQWRWNSRGQAHLLPPLFLFSHRRRHLAESKVRRPYTGLWSTSLFFFFLTTQQRRTEQHKTRWMNLFAWKGELLGVLNNSVFVTDGASVGEHAQLWLIDSLCQNKKLNPIIHIVIGSVETLQLCCLCCLNCNNLAPGGTTLNFWPWVICHCWYLTSQTLIVSRLLFDIWLLNSHKQFSHIHPLLMGA